MRFDFGFIYIYILYIYSNSNEIKCSFQSFPNSTSRYHHLYEFRVKLIAERRWSRTWKLINSRFSLSIVASTIDVRTTIDEEIGESVSDGSNVAEFSMDIERACRALRIRLYHIVCINKIWRDMKSNDNLSALCYSARGRIANSKPYSCSVALFLVFFRAKARWKFLRRRRDWSDGNALLYISRDSVMCQYSGFCKNAVRRWDSLLRT